MELNAGVAGLLDNSTDPWCNPQLGIAAVDVEQLVLSYGCFTNRADTTPPCTPYNALAALEVSPSNVRFPTYPRPKLTFDLRFPYYQPEASLESVNWFGIYQLKNPLPTSPASAWRWVGSAQKAYTGGILTAAGAINHFSTFTLVALPEPVSVAVPGQLEMVVASDFNEEEDQSITVAFEIRATDDPQLGGTDGETRIFRLRGVDPAFSNELPQECLSLDTIANQLSCLLPVETGVSVTLEPVNIMRIWNLDRGYEVVTYATVEVH
ncbi:hypothetical protein GC175_28175 [bacterium]|nr:hypothetical protein [bacterium]